MKNNSYILIIGIQGALAQLLAKLLLQEFPLAKVVGVDSRPVKNSVNDPRFIVEEIKYNRNGFEQLFESYSFSAVYHLGRLTLAKHSTKAMRERLEVNIMGSKIILDLALKFKVEKIIVLSTFHVYGAHAQNPIFLTEQSPLRASVEHHQVRDVVEMDQLCSSWMWQHRDQIKMVILRPCHIIGPTVKNTMTKFLTSPMALAGIDYDPMMQFVHELDMAKILVQCCTKIDSGIFNVASPGQIKLSHAVGMLHQEILKAPIFLFYPINRLANLIGKGIPSYLISYLQFSCLLDAQALERELGKNCFSHSTEQTLKSLKNLSNS
jgi:UDP-glucose 4-epimerase